MNIYRGDIFYVDWVEYNMPVGSEQRPGRPAVIVSNDDDNRRLNTVQVVYLTSQDKTPRPSRVKVMCKVPSIALCEQITTVAQERLGTYVRSCTGAEMAAIDRAIMTTLGLCGTEKTDMDALRARAYEAEKANAELKETNDNLLAALETLKGSNAALNASLDAYKTIHAQIIDKLTKKGDV